MEAGEFLREARAIGRQQDDPADRDSAEMLALCFEAVVTELRVLQEEVRDVRRELTEGVTRV